MRKQEDDNIQHLLGGYASGTLTPEEQQRLFEAAMDDQELFDALAREQALKEVLDDPDSRGYLRKALAETEQKPSKRLAWWWPAAGISTVAAALAVALLVNVQQKTPPLPQVAQSEAPKEMAQNTAPPPQDVEAKPQKKSQQPVASPPPQPQAKREEVEVVPSSPPPPPPPAPAPVVQQAEEKEAAKPVQSASILFLQPRAFGVSAAAAPGAGGAPAVASRARSATAVPQESRRASAETADKAERLSLATGPVANAGIRYRIFRRNSAGEFVETRLDTRFEDGDEIQLLVEANAPGAISILSHDAQGWRLLTPGAATPSGQRSATIRLERGTLELGLILQSPAAAGGAINISNGPRPVVNQLTEMRGNAMYIVAPGLTEGVVATTVRITVH